MKNSRLAIVVVMILALVAAALTRDKAQAMHERANYGPAGKPVGTLSTSSLTGMDSYALALLLGGLRGPLVMVLWSSSETQKNEKNLDDFDTKVEWIRLLQPEFDTVHIFQIWNKAYNISVQMATLSNKYVTILDALEYGHDVDSERPNNVNILTAIGQIYFDKLGGSSEKNYYRKRLREESLPHKTQVTFPTNREEEFYRRVTEAGLDAAKVVNVRRDATLKTTSALLEQHDATAVLKIFSGADVTSSEVTRQKIERSDPAWRRLELDPRLDQDFRVLDPYCKSPAVRPNDLPADVPWSNGTELFFIKKYEPFPQGISPNAFAYAYYKRCQILQNIGKQRHAQMSDLVIDSRPALALKVWAEEEWERARNLEIEAFGLTPPAERLDKEGITQTIALDAQGNEAMLQSAVYCTAMTQRLVDDALVEYQEHIRRFPNNEYTYRSHMDGLLAMAAIVKGDQLWIEARSAKGQARIDKLDAAAQAYRQGIARNGRIILRYYTDDGTFARVAPQGATRLDVPTIPDDMVAPMISLASVYLKVSQNDIYGEDRGEYERYIQRAQARLRTIEAARADASNVGK